MPNFTLEYKVMARADGTFDVCRVVGDRKDPLKKFKSEAQARSYMEDKLGQKTPLA